MERFPETAMSSDSLALTHRVITRLIKPGSSVLDLGCGDGALLAELRGQKKIRGVGIEIDEDMIYKCVERGLSVFHSDIDSGLADYSDKSFDFVILLNSIQELIKPDMAIEDALRVGRQIIVGFPNFAFWKSRLQLLITGKTPVTPALPYKWYETPNLHFLSIEDFVEYCSRKKIRIRREFFIRNGRLVRRFPNLLAQHALFVLEK